MEADVRPMNLGLDTTKRRAQDRSAWWELVAEAIRRLRHSHEEELSIVKRRQSWLVRDVNSQFSAL